MRIFAGAALQDARRNKERTYPELLRNRRCRLVAPRPTPLRHQPSCADQSTPSPVEEGLDLHLPYQQHIWRLPSINTVCAWRLPSKTALHQRTFLRLKRSEEKKKNTSRISRWTAFLTHAATTAFAASLLFKDPTHHHNLDGEPPSLSDLLTQLCTSGDFPSC